MGNNRPIRELRFGSIRAAIWKNHAGTHGTWFSVSVCRVFRTDNGWKESKTFHRDDLPIVSKAMDMAYAWIWDQENPRSEIENTRSSSEESQHGDARA